MKEIDKEWFCEQIYKFVKEHKDEISLDVKGSGFKSVNDMLSHIKSNFDDAYWAFTELMNWGMKDEDNKSRFYTKNLFVAQGYYDNQNVIYQMCSKCFTPIYEKDNNFTPKYLAIVKKIPKTIYVYEIEKD